MRPLLADNLTYYKLTSLVLYCKTHTYLILLNRRRVESQGAHSCPQQTASKSPLRGRDQVLFSCEGLLTAFLFLYLRARDALVSWSIGQQAFNACMLLLSDAMDTGDLGRIEKVEQAFIVFLELQNKSMHGLARNAVDQVSGGLAEIKRMVAEGANNPGVAPTSFTRRKVQMQGTARHECMEGPCPMHDTVMGNTGLLLLEDPGLQSFVPDAFAPLTVSMGRGELDSTASAPTNLKDEEGRKLGQGPLSHADLTGQFESLPEARSSEGMYNGQGSAPGSAPLRNATFSTAPSRCSSSHRV